MGQSKCYTNNCLDSRNTQTFFEIKLTTNQQTNYLNTKNLYFFNQIKSFLKKDSFVQILSGKLIFL
jgi:hypothetical protein